MTRAALALLAAPTIAAVGVAAIAVDVVVSRRRLNKALAGQDGPAYRTVRAPGGCTCKLCFDDQEDA